MKCNFAIEDGTYFETGPAHLVFTIFRPRLPADDAGREEIETERMNRKAEPEQPAVGIEEIGDEASAGAGAPRPRPSASAGSLREHEQAAPMIAPYRACPCRR